MFTQILMFLNLAGYSFLVAQSLMYMIALENLQRNIPAPAYVGFRHIVDRNFRSKFKYPFYSTLITSSTLTAITAGSPASLLFITSLVAFLAFVTETIFMLRGNMPINKAINTWTRDDYPDNWEVFRDRWLKVFRYRQVANITGFVSLLVGAVFS